MEDKIGYAFIPTAEYKRLIEDNINKEKCIKELNEEAFKRDSINKKLEKYLLDSLSSSENYHLESMKECNPTDYHYGELYKCFLKIGIDNVEYIHLSIVTMKRNFDHRENKEKEE